MPEYKPLVCKSDLDATKLLFRTGDLFNKNGKRVSPFVIELPTWAQLNQKEAEKKE